MFLRIMLLRGAEGVFLMAKCILEANGLQVSFGDRQLLDIDRLTVWENFIDQNG